jgi:hypothetical protein
VLTIEANYVDSPNPENHCPTAFHQGYDEMNSRLPSARPLPAARPVAEGHDPAIRSDADNLQIIEHNRARHDALRTEKVRVERDIETNEQRLSEALASAMTKFGTDDIEKLREMVRDNYHANTANTDAYAAAIERIERDLAALKGPVAP